MSKKNTNTKHKSKPSKQNTVMVGHRKMVIHNSNLHPFRELYHLSLTTSWTRFFIASALVFVLLNVVFAVLYMFDTDGLANISPTNLLGAFFFSVETLATVGYGDMHPTSVYVHTVATVEMFVGTFGTAMLTGLVFARFSKPRSRIMFADSPVISMLDGKPTLMIRTANARQNFIVGASAKLYVMLTQTTSEGQRFRRIYDLNLVRVDQPMFFIGWTVMHTIDESSPIFGKTAADLKVSDALLVLNMQGLDESTAQLMQARQLYSHDAIKWQHNYVDITYSDADGTSHIDYSMFHETQSI